MNCQVVVPAKTIGATEWAGLSLFQVLKERDVLSTDRLTQEKCQLSSTNIFCTGGKALLSFLLSRSGNEWVVFFDDTGTDLLKASVGDNPLIPPATGWKFLKNEKDYTFEEDPQLRCSSTCSSTSCSVSVSLSGLAKDIQGECEGEYKDTGLRSMGKKVINFPLRSFAHFLKLLLGVQTGGPC